MEWYAVAMICMNDEQGICTSQEVPLPSHQLIGIYTYSKYALHMKNTLERNTLLEVFFHLR